MIVLVPVAGGRYCASMADDWRVCIALGGGSVRSIRQALWTALDGRLSGYVTVSSNATQIFLYAPSIRLADEAAQVAREVLAQRNVDAPVRTESWSYREQQWRDADEMPADPAADRQEEERARHAYRQEEERARSARTGFPAWEVRIELPSHRDVVALAGQLAAQGWRVRRRPRSLIVSANCEDDARGLFSALSGDGDADADMAIRVGRVSLRYMFVLPEGMSGG